MTGAGQEPLERIESKVDMTLNEMQLIRRSRSRQRFVNAARAAGITGLLVAVGFGLFSALTTRTIIDSISTRYIRTFPSNLDKINEMLESAEKEIVVMSDVAAYGNFSAHTGFTTYKSLLARKSADLEIRVSVYPDKLMRKTLEDQFRPARIEDLLNGARFQGYWAEHEAIRRKIASLAHSTPAEAKRMIIDELYSQELGFRENLRKEWFEVGQLKGEAQVFCWIVDGKQAIFSILTDTEATEEEPYGLREVSFETKDSHLIEVLKKLERSYVSARPTDSEEAAIEGVEDARQP